MDAFQNWTFGKFDPWIFTVFFVVIDLYKWNIYIIPTYMWTHMACDLVKTSQLIF